MAAIEAAGAAAADKLTGPQDLKQGKRNEAAKHALQTTPVAPISSQ